MDKKKLYEYILSLAKDLEKNDSVYTRSDLAFALKKMGITQDSLDVSRMVMEAYNYFGNNESIKRAFSNNEGTKSIVEDYAVSQFMDNGQYEEAFGQLNAELGNANSLLGQLAKISSESAIEGKSGSKLEITSWLRGTKGVKNVREAAKVYFNKYSSLVNIYSCARDDVKAIISDFVDIRGSVADVYREYAIKLVDVFGDSIKSVAPNLFDFEEIEYLNVDEMHKAIQLQYETLVEKCALLVQDIDTSFFQALRQSTKAIGSYATSDNSAKLIEAVATMWGHYSYASEQRSVANQELEKFKQDIKHDVTIIAGDYTRLSSIFKILNDLYIPKAEAFYKYSHKVLTDELQQIFDVLYMNEEICEIVKKRDAVMEECRTIERNIADHKLNIEYYKGSIANGQELLNYKQSDYHKAINSKPTKPFFLKNLLTFGHSNKKYNKQMYEWREYMEPVVIEYDSYKCEIKLDSDELRGHQQNLKRATDELHKKKIELKNLNRQITDKIQVSDEVKLQLSKHLGDILTLLHIAREIVESKLDAKHLKAVNIKNARKTDLPEDVKDRLDSFTGSLQEQLAASLDEEDMDEEDKSLAQTGNKMVEQNLSMLKELSKLMMMQQQGELVKKEYDKALQDIRTQFEKEMKETDDKSALLMETIRRMKTATDKAALKEALLALNGEGEIISKSDLDAFLSGNKQIEI